MKVKDILETMEYGEAPESPQAALDWIAGHGDGFGLFIDASIDRGSSARCATYENAPLAGPGSETFEVARLECWGVGAF